MSKVNIDDIRKLREMTGVGMTDAKQALVEVGGDFNKAFAAMKKKGLAKAAKRGERQASAGLVGTYSHDGRIGVVVEINCETDFVAKTDEFKELVKDVCLQVAATDVEKVDQLLKSEFIKDPSKTIDDVVKEVIAKLGENIIIRRFHRLVLGA